MDTPNVILVRAAYYGILSLFTDFVVAWPERAVSDGAEEDFASTKRWFLVVLPQIVGYGDVRGLPGSPAAAK